MKKDISERIDIYKFILSIMVIFIHSYSSQVHFASGTVSFDIPLWLQDTKYILSQSISRCAVPGFFFISSFLLYRRPFTFQANLIKKLKTLGIPFLLLNTVWILVFWAAQQLPFTKNFFSDSGNIIRNWGLYDYCNAFLGFGESLCPFLYPLWFLRDLLALNLLAKIIGKLIDKAPIVMLAVSLILWFTVESTGIFFLNIQGVCFWIFGGILAVRNVSLQKADRIPLPLFAAGYLLAGTLDLFTRETPVHFYAHRLVVLWGVFFWFACTKLCMGTKVKRPLLRLSAYSFSIYIFHEFTLTVAKKLCAGIFPATALSQLIQYIGLPFLIAGLCIAASICLKKLLPQLYCILVGGRNAERTSHND